MKIHNKLNESQSGMVSILVSMIMMVVITLVVLGFSQLSRNELTQSLNRQLSAEAFYAANSGINNAATIINHDLATNTPLVSQTTSCTQDNAGGNTYNANSTLNATNAVSYSCITVNPAPTTIARSITSGTFYAFPVSVVGGVPISTITFKWDDVLNGTNFICPTVGHFPAARSWPLLCDPGVLQVNLISQTDSQSLAGQKNAYDFFLYPHQGAPSGAAPLSNNTVYQVPCNAASLCTYSLTIPAPQPIFYVRVLALYKDTALTVSANLGLPLSGVQAEIDATGKAQNILQRLSARVALGNLGGVPFAVQTGTSLCKRLEGYTNYAVETLPNGVAPSSATASCTLP